MRIVRTPDGVRYDATGKAEGRGAYLHDKKSCWQRALRGSLAHALKTELTQADREYIAQIISELKDDE
jgi:predicted RNA-binding protein YlxR (DUF448 family)